MASNHHCNAIWRAELRRLRIATLSQTFACVRRGSAFRPREGKNLLGGVAPRYYQEEAVQLFFQRARDIRNLA